MIKVINKFNVDTLVVTDTYVSAQIGDIIKVIADFEKPLATTPRTPAPIGWSLGQVPLEGQGHTVFTIIGEDMFEGSMTFQVTDSGTAWVTYTMTAPERKKETKFIITE